MTKARKAALTEFRIGNRTAFLAHTRLAKPAICFEGAIVLLALDYISPRRRRLCHIALIGLRDRALRDIVAGCGALGGCRLGMGRHGRDRCQANARETQTHRSPKHHDGRLLRIDISHPRCLAAESWSPSPLQPPLKLTSSKARLHNRRGPSGHDCIHLLDLGSF